METATLARHWIHTTYCCAVVDVNDHGVIVWTAPIFRKYKGWPIESMLGALRRKGHLKRHEIL